MFVTGHEKIGKINKDVELYVSKYYSDINFYWLDHNSRQISINYHQSNCASI